MKLAVMQPYFFPYIGYFQLIAAVERFILYDLVDYIRHGWVNRNRLLRVGGEPFYVVAPLQKHGLQTPIRSIRLDPSSQWRRSICKLLESNYRRAPFFNQVYPLVAQVLMCEYTYLSDLNRATIRMVCQFLEISTEIVSDCTPYQPLENDLRAGEGDLMMQYQTQHQLIDRKTIRVLEICKREGATTYLNAIGGQSMYDKAVFACNALQLFFVQSRPYHYAQRADFFFPHLSILDVLMNCGKAQTQSMLTQYDLI